MSWRLPGWRRTAGGWRAWLRFALLAWRGRPWQLIVSLKRCRGSPECRLYEQVDPALDFSAIYTNVYNNRGG